MEPNSSRPYPVCGKDLNSSNSYYTPKWPEIPTYRKLVKMTGCLEIIDGEDSGICKDDTQSQDNSRPSSNMSLRPWSRGSVGCAPPRVDSALGRRMNTPTKQVALQAVRRKEESADPFVEQVNLQSMDIENGHQMSWQLGGKTAQGEQAQSGSLKDKMHSRLDCEVDTSQNTTKLHPLKKDKAEREEDPSHLKLSSDKYDVKTAQDSEIRRKDKDRDEEDSRDNDEDDDDDDGEDDSDSSDEEESKRMAPNELLMEFVDCLMRKDYQTANKLCKMILLYEPDNPQAVKFQPLIEEKIALDDEAKQEATDEESEDDSSEDDDDDDDGDSDDDEDDDDDDDDKDSSDDDDDSSSAADSSDNDSGDGNAGDDICRVDNHSSNAHFDQNPQSCHKRD